MGEAVREISKKYPGKDGPAFRQVVMAAPDIKLTVMQALQRAMVSRSRRVTLYTSTNDDALILARIVDGIARVGEKIVREAMEPGVDAVDASAVRTDFVGHGYYADSQTMLTDLRRVPTEASPASAGNLRSAKIFGLPYWVIPGKH